MQGYKSELLAAPRYQLVFEAVKPLFDNFSTKKLARLIGGIVALTKESDLAADASFAVNATWATNMTKASIASNVAAGVGAIAPALGAALTTSAILIMKVVVVAIAVYAAYRALKLMWKLAVWVANKIGEMVRKKKKPDEEESKNCDEWNASNAMIVYDIVEKAVQHFFEDKDKGKSWTYKVGRITVRRGSKILLANKTATAVQDLLKVACCALENQQSVSEQCALAILKTYLERGIFNLTNAGKKAEVYKTLQKYYDQHELFFCGK